MEPKSVEKASRSYVSAFDLFSKSSALVQANLGVYSIVVGVPILLSLIRNGILYGYGEGLKMMNGGLPFFGNGLSGAARDVTITGTAIALGLVIAVVGFIFAFMSVVLQYEVANGRKPTMSDLWEKVQKFGPRLFGLFIVVGLLVVLGFVALIVPGVILIKRYYLAPYVMLDQDTSIGEAMKISSEISHPGMAIWGILGVSILIAFTNVIPLIGWVVGLILSTLYSAAGALRHRELKNKEHHDTPAVTAS